MPSTSFATIFIVFLFLNRTLLFLLLLVSALLGGPLQADAKETQSPRLQEDILLRDGERNLGWPEFRIPYKITNPRVARVGHWAARAWNRARVRYRFVPVQNRADAKVLISKYPICGAGLANVGYLSEQPSRAQISSCSSRFDRAIAVHELGHILGLWHYGKCQLMSPVICPGTSPRPSGKDKRLVRQMARNRDREVARAPKSPSIKILNPTMQVDEYDGEVYVSVDMEVRMSASFQDRFWNIPEVLSTAPSGENYCDLEDFDWPDGEYGPWGWAWNQSWRVTEYATCYFENPEGVQTIRASNKSYSGTYLQDEYVFTYP